jgi:hypothetical protein
MTVDHNHLPSQWTIATATDENLEQIADTFSDHAWDCDQPVCARIARWAENEQDARYLATNDDPRVRESVGVYV